MSIHLFIHLFIAAAMSRASSLHANQKFEDFFCRVSCHGQRTWTVNWTIYIYIYIYIFVCDFEEDHKGRESSNSFGVFRVPQTTTSPPYRTRQTPWASCYTSRFVGLTTASVRTPSFRTSRPLSHVKRIHANVEGWNAYASGSDHPRWVISSGKIHTGIFFFWMSTPYRLSSIKCCFWQRNPLCRDLAV